MNHSYAHVSMGQAAPAKRLKKLKRGVDWHGWCWQYVNDPYFGNMLDTEVYEHRVTWANGHERKGRWVKVRIVPVEERA